MVFHEYAPADPLDKTLTNAADMSGADTEPDVIMMSGNWFCDVSDDAGATWRRLDPTTIFPERFAGGFCCDQVITYVDSIDRFVWFLQYNADAGGQGAFRIAAASSDSVRSDPTAWTFWDFVAGDFGFPASDMDYPDLAFSDGFLYAGTDVFEAGGRLVVRIPLEDLQAGGTVSFEFTDPAQSTSAWGAHLVQETRSQAVWAGHPSNSTLEVFTMPDGGDTYSSFTVPVAAWPNGTHSSAGPDGNDWLTKLANFPNFAVTGGIERDNGNIVLAWSASNGKGTDDGFDFPNTHARLVEVDLAAQAVVSEFQIWNPDYAFAYPNLGVNARGDVGVILGWGGSQNHANCAMGIIGDFVVWFRDDSTRTVQRFGDYLTTRRGRRNRASSEPGATSCPRTPMTRTPAPTTPTTPATAGRRHDWRYAAMSSGPRRRHGTMRARFWVELGLAVAAALLAVVTLIWHDWIEILFQVEPDGGISELEWALAAGLAVLAVGFAVAARLEFRRAAAEEAAV